MCSASNILNPAANLVPGDPLASKAVSAVTPNGIERIPTSPLRALSRGIGQNAASRMVTGGISTPDADKQGLSLVS